MENDIYIQNKFFLKKKCMRIVKFTNLGIVSFILID